MYNIINKYWENKKIPGVNSIIYKDGRVIILNCFTNEVGLPFCFPYCETTLGSLLKYNDDIWAKVQVFKTIKHKHRDIISRRRGYGE